jgi:hypothetical protein
MQMSDPGISDANEDLVIYERLAKVWEFASIDRKVSFREAVFIPIKGEYAPVGAAMFTEAVSAMQCSVPGKASIQLTAMTWIPAR